MARKIFLIATEESGDRLGASLMKVLRQRLGGAVRFEGVGGRAMAREGLASLFPIEELSIIGLAAVVKQLPTILRRIRETADAVLEAAPDVLVIIDSPDFTHRVARRVRARDPANSDRRLCLAVGLGVAAGPGARDARYVDHVLALLPFEPEAYRRLRGPPCTYVGHPLIEQIGRAAPGRRRASAARRNRRRCCWCCRAAGAARSGTTWRCSARRWRRLQAQGVAFEPVLPTMPHLHDAVTEGVKNWPVQPRIVVGEQEKRAAFRIAHAALAKSGTVTLELAMAGVPMVAAYRTGTVEALICAASIKVIGDSRQSRDRRERRAGIPAGGLHAGETGCRRCATCSATRRCGGGRVEAFAQARRASCRPATSRRACAPPKSCWRRCGRRGGDRS